jgi:WD40-like Beta Propeller Repeat
MSDRRSDRLDRFSRLFETPDPSIQRFLRLRDRKRRNQRITAGVVGIAIFVVPILVFAVLISPDRNGEPAGTGPTTPPASSDVPNVDYVLDLRTGDMTPLPIIRDAGGSPLFGQYAASPDGFLLAYVGVKENGSRQIFIGGVSSRDPRQLTNLPRDGSPSSPAWSPDGSSIAFVATDREGVRNLFIVDVGTGESTQVTHRTGDLYANDTMDGIQFTPDGSSVIYSDGPVVRTQPIAGGRSTLLIGPGEGVSSAGNASMSPDGSLVTFLGSGSPESEDPGFHCGPCRFVANADGTDRRVIPGWVSNPAGTWSPDGTQIVARGTALYRIVVVDVASGKSMRVAQGTGAIWIDDHTLLVETDLTVDTT